MPTVPLVVVVLALIAQGDPSLDASRQAIAGRSFHAVAPSGVGPDVLMGSGGRPRIVRSTGGTIEGIVGGDGTRTEWRNQLTQIIEYTGRPARRCDGTTQRGELVVRYEYRDSTKAWTTTALAQAADEVGPSWIDQALAMLRGVKPMSNGERRQINGRPARELIASWEPRTDPRSQPPKLTGDPIPNVTGDPALNETIQSLWIDTESLLPLRWEVTKRGMIQMGYDFRYERINLQRPAGVTRPDCVR